MTSPAWRVVPAKWLAIWGTGEVCDCAGNCVEVEPPSEPDFDAMAVEVFRKFMGLSDAYEVSNSDRKDMTAALRACFEGQP